ncbi:MAG: PIN domain-containing protein [Sulfurospirillum sp.]|nr:PIN domain-containing protein [Sulfurospirillum sp.]
MKVLLDTNIVLDLLLDREPFSELAQKIFLKIEREEIQGFLCPTTLTTIYYLLNKHLTKAQCDQAVSSLLELFEVTQLNKYILNESLKNVGTDFEDSVIYTSAKDANIDILITRDQSGFKKSTTKVMLPHEFLIFLDIK